MVGVSGRRVIVAMVDIASRSVDWVDGRRQGTVPVKVLGDMVSVMA